MQPPAMTSNAIYIRMNNDLRSTILVINSPDNSHELRMVYSQLGELHNQLQAMGKYGTMKEGIIHRLQTHITALGTSIANSLSAGQDATAERKELGDLQKRLLIIHIELKIVRMDKDMRKKARQGDDVTADRAQLEELGSQLEEIKGEIVSGKVQNGFRGR